jgi:hypothetical protein
LHHLAGVEQRAFSIAIRAVGMILGGEGSVLRRCWHAQLRPHPLPGGATPACLYAFDLIELNGD